MDQSRRNFLITSGLAALIAGCQDRTKTASLPGAVWPSLPGRSAAGSPYIPEDDYPEVPGRDPGPITAGVGTPANPIPRSSWASRGPYTPDLNPMNGISRITLHHEGYTAVPFTDVRTTAARMEQMRSAHRNRGWADIGYHYVIDRAGRVWQGRDIRYQGAHVRDNNEHNVGIMCLGNFDLQTPTEAQLQTLRDTVRYVRQKYNVSMKWVKTHQEINRTACPGRNLQPRIVAMRSNGQFV